MAENYDSNNEQKGFFQKFLDLFKTKSKVVADKVEDTVQDVKNSEFGAKVANAAENVRDKAKDVVEDVKNSEFAGKVADVAENVRDKAKDVVEDIKDSKFADKVEDVADKAKGMGGKALEKLGTLANLPVLINAGKKLQESAEDTTEKENLLKALDAKVATILEDGVITPEEETALTEEAKAIGIDVDEFLTEVRGRLTAK
ncbi:MAG: hypothetical protein K6A41_00780 [Bacteroidales bacterium]|nr:hypothetical protein [Bacteroidales bacterium]